MKCGTEYRCGTVLSTQVVARFRHPPGATVLTRRTARGIQRISACFTKVSATFKVVAAIDISAIMLPGTVGTAASEKISLPGRLGRLGNSFGQSTGAGVLSPSWWRTHCAPDE